MKMRLTVTIAATAIGSLLLAATAIAMIGIYRNDFETLGQRSQLVKLTGRSCARAGVGGALRVTVGKRTGACSYRTSVLGRDLEIVAKEKLLSTTPPKVARKAYVGLELRAGGGAKYQLLVFPRQRKAQLLKVTKDKTKYLDIDKADDAIKGVDEANELRLRAVNVTSGPDKGQALIAGFVGKTQVVAGADKAAGELKGRASSVVFGAAKNGNGVVAGVDDVVIRVPNPYAKSEG